MRRIDSAKRLPTEYLKSVAMLAVPLSVLAVTMLSLTEPNITDWLAREDGPIENLSALFLILAATVLTTATIVAKRKKKPIITIIALTTLAVVSFVIGAEEISWGQRILNLESGQYFIENSSQREINFHNLSTSFFESLYYLSAFVAFIIVPFFSTRLSNFFKNNRHLRNLNLFLPNEWFFIMFASTAGLTGPYFWTSLSSAIPISVTLAL